MMDVKKDVKADHIQKILAEMWKNETPDVRQQYIAKAKEASASMSQWVLFCTTNNKYDWSKISLFVNLENAIV